MNGGEKMETDWVDFRIIKAAVTMQMVLDRYGVTLKKSGHELRGKCPIHRGSNNKHFTVNVSKNVFKCFFMECGAHGNVLDFVAAMERCSVRDAAIKLRDFFKIGETSLQSAQEVERSNESAEVRRGIYRNKEGALVEVMTTATSAEDFKPLVVYRELFGNYQLLVGSPILFIPDAENSDHHVFSLVKEF